MISLEMLTSRARQARERDEIRDSASSRRSDRCRAPGDLCGYRRQHPSPVNLLEHLGHAFALLVASAPCRAAVCPIPRHSLVERRVLNGTPSGSGDVLAKVTVTLVSSTPSESNDPLLGDQRKRSAPSLLPHPYCPHETLRRADVERHSARPARWQPRFPRRTTQLDSFTRRGLTIGASYSRLR